MAVVSSQYLDAVLTNFRAMFAREFRAASAYQGWMPLVIRVDAAGVAENTFEWFGTVPRMQDVTDKNVDIDALDEYNFSIRNREYQDVIEVTRMALERDRLNLIAPRIRQLSQEAARFPGELVYELIEDNVDAYDGVAFFADSRTIGDSGTIDNNLNGTGTNVTQIRTDLASAQTQMSKYKDDRGRPMGLTGNVIMVPPDLRYQMIAGLTASAGGGSGETGLTAAIIPPMDHGVANVGGYSIIVNPYLTDANNWYLFHVGGGEDKPFIWQVEKNWAVESDTNPNSRENILQRKYLYSVYGRMAVGATDPRFGIRVNN